ncbi:MAG: 2-dehydro-3-deoxy-D-gluconate 5-dehydrogenase KduD [Bacteroidetes bacterium]|nr:MAG: 2-dehydro-3-deoxy-D-gluconate 5-dehydrogenase KduD [Bacteroidota bacterium]
MQRLFDLTNTVAIVTGASTGLGQGMACGLADAGADIVLVDRNDVAESANAIQALGRKTLAIQGDLKTIGPVPMIVEKTLQEFGKIDILVNNAGIIRRTPAVDFSVQDWDDVMNTNIRTLFFLCQAVGREMLKRKRGKIINIASLLSFQGGITVPSYTASKGAVAQLTKALANEWAQHGINVNAIAPGYMATKNTENLRNDPVRFKSISERIPAGRWGLPEDLQGAVIFLASKASDYVNGHILAVDGGWLAR